MTYLTLERICDILAAFGRYQALTPPGPRVTSPLTEEAFEQTFRLNTSPEWRQYVQLLDSLSRDELLEFAAIYFLGRGSAQTFDDGLRAARSIAPEHLAGHIAQSGILDRTIPRGLEELGIQL